ncbi:transcriptional regulator [Peptostreptococcaceae bacterium oral taxon 929]|nr:transcriptional regulator [Peptostreptococcaceae bacterium oral taxon 929]
MQISGKKLRRLRLLRNFTQKELAVKSGITDAAVRNYELGNRSPNKEQLIKIAEVLNCDTSALLDYGSSSRIIQILFDYEKDIKLIPVIEENGVRLTSTNPAFICFLLDWIEMQKKYNNGEITDEELEDWKLSYSIKPIEKSIEMEM